MKKKWSNNGVLSMNDIMFTTIFYEILELVGSCITKDKIATEVCAVACSYLLCDIPI